MAGPIIPTARAAYLCNQQVGYQDGTSDLYGIFHSIRPTSGYPHTHPQFCVFAQLTGGLGRVPFWIDIRHAGTRQLVRATNVNHLHFPNRTVVVRMAMGVQGCVFPLPGMYLVELFCDNQWVADTPLELL